MPAAPETGRQPSRHRAAIALLFLAAGALLAFRWTYEPDLFWHLAQGREIARSHLVGTNFFSSTFPDYRQPSTSWLFDLGAYGLWQAGGAAAVQLGQALAVALALAILLRASRVRASLPTALAVLALGFFVIEPRALPRPHTLSLAGMAACALLVELASARREARVLLWAAPLVALWCNFHVECFFGVVLLGIFAGAEFAWPQTLDRRQAIAAGLLALLAAAATVVNPYGIGLLLYLWENASVPSVIRIAELQPPYLPNYAPFFTYLVAGAGLLVFARRRVAAWEALVFAVFAMLALRHLRFTAMFFCATAPIVAAHLEAFGRQRGHTLVVVSLAVGMLVSRVSPATLVSGLAAGTDALVPPDMFPVGATEFAQRIGLRGPLFNSNNLGGYLIWAGYPDLRVFQDSRLQAYPPDHFRRIMDSSRSQPAWDALVEHQDWAVLSRPRPNELSGAGRFPRRAWATVYWDEASEVLVRRDGVFAHLIPSFEYEAFLPETDPFTPLDGTRGMRLRAEARRNADENPDGFAALVVLCRSGDAEACLAADRLEARRPGTARLATRLRSIRSDARLRSTRSDAR